MEQPPPVVGQVSHPGLGQAIAEFSASTDPGGSWVPIGAQLLYGYVLVNMTGSTIDSGPYGTTMMPGSTISIHAIRDADDRGGLPVFSSHDEIQATMPAGSPAAASMVHPADTIFELVAAMGLDFIVLNPASAQVTIRSELAEQALSGPHDVGLRAALERGPAEARRTILDGLAEADGVLFLARDPDSNGAEGPAHPAGLRMTSSPTGGPLISLYTSAAEVALRHMSDVPIQQNYDSALAGTLGGGYEGAILNPGSSWIILTRAELQAVAARRAKLAAKNAKAAAKQAKKSGATPDA